MQISRSYFWQSPNRPGLDARPVVRAYNGIAKAQGVEGLGDVLQDAANDFAKLGQKASCAQYVTNNQGGLLYNNECKVDGYRDYYDAGYTSEMTPAQIAASLALSKNPPPLYNTGSPSTSQYQLSAQPFDMFAVADTQQVGQSVTANVPVVAPNTTLPATPTSGKSASPTGSLLSWALPNNPSSGNILTDVSSSTGFSSTEIFVGLGLIAALFLLGGKR